MNAKAWNWIITGVCVFVMIGTVSAANNPETWWGQHWPAGLQEETPVLSGVMLSIIILVALALSVATWSAIAAGTNVIVGPDGARLRFNGTDNIQIAGLRVVIPLNGIHRPDLGFSTHGTHGGLIAPADAVRRFGHNLATLGTWRRYSFSELDAEAKDAIRTGGILPPYVCVDTPIAIELRGSDSLQETRRARILNRKDTFLEDILKRTTSASGTHSRELAAMVEERQGLKSPKLTKWPWTKPKESDEPYRADDDDKRG